jgi:hypothetical protein
MPATVEQVSVQFFSMHERYAPTGDWFESTTGAALEEKLALHAARHSAVWQAVRQLVSARHGVLVMHVLSDWQQLDARQLVQAVLAGEGSQTLPGT